MNKVDLIRRFIPEYYSVLTKAEEEDEVSGWYFAMTGIFSLVLERGLCDPDLLRRVSEFIEWAYTQNETIETAATIELLEPLLYDGYGPAGELFEAKLGTAAREFLASVRAET